MADIETLEEFYRNKFNWMPDGIKNDMGHFNVFSHENNESHNKVPVKYSRRDFYKISLSRGEYIFHYADKSIKISGSTLLFFNPLVPYKVERLSPDPTGYFCIFKEAFFNDHVRGQINKLPMFLPGANSAYALNEKQDQQVSDIFKKTIDEMASDYLYKYDLVRSYVMEIVHMALKLRPAETLHQYSDANARISAVFADLLERQFPIESLDQQFKMRSAKDYAERLCVHVNHLNRAIRLTTGKTTTDLIFERVISEAKALLKYTSWNVAEISFCLGFEEPAHFNHFFKKLTDTTPSGFRSLAD